MTGLLKNKTPYDTAFLPRPFALAGKLSGKPSDIAKGWTTTRERSENPTPKILIPTEDFLKR